MKSYYTLQYIRRYFLFLILIFFVFTSNATPTIGNYPASNVRAGGNIAVNPTAAPTGTTSLTVSTSSTFTGVLTADPVSGTVRITNAKPAGTYTIKVSANGSTIKTFVLTVTNTICSQATFSSYSTISNGSFGNPYFMAVGDFNNDGNQDMVRANAIGQFDVYMGSGVGDLVNNLVGSTGASPTSVAIGDFNGDGKEDIVVSNSGSNTLSLRMGDGTGYFNFSPDVSTGSTPYCVAVGDFNNDNIQDLAVANSGSNNVSIKLGNGLGGFSGSTTVSVGTSPRYLVVGDFNGDGNQDIATANFGSSNVSIRLGNGLGSFSGSTNISVGTQPVSLAVGYFNPDAIQDLIVTNYGSNNASVLLGTGSGTFTSATTLITGSQPMFASIGDFNSDGNQDVVIANSGSNTVYEYPGNGSGGFGSSSSVTFGANPYCVVVSDLNNDGIQDLISSSHSTGSLDFKLGDFKQIAVGNNIVSGLSNSQFDFGNTTVGSTITNAIQIANIGTLPLTVSNITNSNPGDFTFYGLTTPFTINANTFPAVLWVDFTPASPGIRTSTVHITSNDCNISDFNFVISGRGCDPADTNTIHVTANGLPVLASSNGFQSSTDFDSVAIGDTALMTFVIYNPATYPVSLHGLAFTANNTSEYQLTGTLPDTIHPLQSVIFTVKYFPSTTNTNFAYFEFYNSNCLNAYYPIIIHGVGYCPPISFTSCPANQNVTALSDSCRAAVNYTTTTSSPAQTLSYSFTGATSSTGNGNGSGSNFNNGITHVKITASNICSTDSCNFDVTVIPDPDDNNVCTIDGCDTSGNVTHTPVNIDDGNLCTTDGCDPSTGIYHLAVNTNDNNVCTTDGCNSLTGIFHTPVSVNDNNVCTTDACNSITGISHTLINFNDNNACTTDACDPVTGISHTAINVNDNNVCTTDGCNTLTGPTHTLINFNDNNVCTTDACDPVTGISHSLINIDDNNVCTTDACNSISGVSHIPINIDDNNICTTDACDPVRGISHTLINFDDNNLCTTDACDPLTGPSHTPVITNDSIAFTVDGCNPLTGIFHNEIFNLKLFLEGFYTGNGLMDNSGKGGCMFIVGLNPDTSVVDSIELTLMDTVSFLPVGTSNGLLHTNGLAAFNFNSVIAGNYYLKVNHRNSIETWSASPVSLINTNFYDFTTDSSKAYGNNEAETFDHLSWAIYSGDISDSTNIVGNQDGIIDLNDYSEMYNAVYFTYEGYVVEDINGDGVVESADFSLMENNVFYTIVVMRP